MPQAIPAVVGFFKAAIAYVGAASAAVATGTATVAQVATVVAVNLGSALATSAIAKALSPQPKTGAAPGAANDWRADPDAPVPIGYGRFGSGGYIVFQKPHGSGDKYLTTVSVLSLGPIEAVEKQWIGTETLVAVNSALDGELPTGNAYKGAVWTRWQLGATPEGAALPVATAVGALPEWTTSHKLSGYAAVISSFDVSNTAKLPKGVQRARWDCKFQKCYDPRKDGTYPGGTGTHRIDNSTTWEWTQNPYLCALHWVIGVTHNGKPRAGIFAAPDQIRLADFVAGANVADANSWGCGALFTTADSKWGVLTALLEAGGGVPVIQGGQIGCIVKKARLAVGTITPDQIVSCEATHGPQSSTRFNTAIPKYNSEPHGWQVVAGSPIAVAAFVTADGGPATKELSWSAVTSANQAAALSVHKIYDARANLTLSLECLPVCAQYMVGECVNVKWRDHAQTAVKCEIIKRTWRPDTGTVLLVLRREDDQQYTDAAAATSGGPTVVDFGPSGTIQTPLIADWSSTTGHEGTNYWINITGTPSNITGLTTIALFYKISTNTEWIALASEPASGSITARINGLTNEIEYDIGVQYWAGLRSSSITKVGSNSP